MHGAADLSSFYFGNEEVARALQRLERSGALDELLGLLADFELELVVESRREAQGMRERIGRLSPRPEAAARRLPLAGDDGLTRASRFDALSTLTARSRFELTLSEGEPAEVYMPDHVCPSCLNDRGNVLESCQRVCVACGFRW